MGQFRTVKKAKEHFERMIAEANTAENSPQTRQNCRECAEWIESVFLSDDRPKLRRVPFSWQYEVVCPSCGEPLCTDEGECLECGKKINWII